MRKLFAIVTLCLGLSVQAATSVSQYGITWTWTEDLTVGQYANGDYYVVAPSGLTMTSITPASTLNAGRTINGTMLNPPAGILQAQGFDSAMASNTWTSSLNVARPGGNSLSVGNPLAVSAGSSLISSISHVTPGVRPQLTDAAVLTVVASAPSAGSFRPPYSGSDKTHNWNKSSLNYSILKNLATVTGAPSLASVEATVIRPWIEIQTNVGGRHMHPSNNQPDFGREMGSTLGRAMLRLHLNNTNAEKEMLYIHCVQKGIDVYGAAVNGGVWRANGGHNLSRKMPLVLAAVALGDSNIAEYADAAQHFIFQEDQQTWMVAAGDVGDPKNDQYISQGRPRYTYTTAMIGLPEWGIEHFYELEGDGSNWGVIYRDVNNGTAWQHALMAQLTTGAKTAWNWDPFFDFIDRARHVDQVANYSGYTFEHNMWLNYRSQGATEYSTPAPVISTGWIPVSGTSMTIEFTTRITPGAGGSGGVVITASGGAVTWTYASGSGTWALTGTLSRTIGVGETVTFNYTNPTNGFEDSVGGADVATATGHAVVNYSTAAGGGDVTAPTATPVTINPDGLTATLALSENGQIGAGGSGGFVVTMSGGSVTLTYIGISGNNLSFSLSRKVYDIETGTYVYTQPGNGIEDLAGNDLASISSTAITNNSEQTEANVVTPASITAPNNARVLTGF